MRPPATGGPAFPRPASEYTASGTLDDGNDAIREQGGMSLRQWYAGQALAGLAGYHGGPGSPSARAEAAAECFAIADAMIAHELELRL
jgi:hypothetical protein